MKKAGPDPVAAFSAAAELMAFVFAVLVTVGFVSALGTHNVPIVNASEKAPPVMIADVSMLAVLAPEAGREE